MKRLVILTGLLAGLLVPGIARSGNGHTPVTICHHTGHGQHTIVVDNDAVPAHIAHGDTLGPCVLTIPDPTSETVPPLIATPRPHVTPPATTTQ